MNTILDSGWAEKFLLFKETPLITGTPGQSYTCSSEIAKPAAFFWSEYRRTIGSNLGYYLWIKRVGKTFSLQEKNAYVWENVADGYERLLPLIDGAEFD